MTAAIVSIVTANWQAVAGVFAAIAAALGLYAKGRSDAKAKAKQEDTDRALEIHKAGSDARNRVDADIAAGGVLAKDKWQRD